MATVCNTDKFAMHHACHTAEHTDRKKNEQNHQHSEGLKFIQKKKKEKMPNDNQNLKPL
jgi:hypothetical protein